MDTAAMALASHSNADDGRMTAEEFFAFYETRPEQEQWELIAGVPIMMTPPTLSHNIISGNLVGLINEAAFSIKRPIIAIQRSGVSITDNDYRPEPDVIVIDNDFEPDQRYSDRVYLLAETISRSDRIPVPGEPAKWIDVKRKIYRAHPVCEAIVFIEQNIFDVMIDIRSNDGWVTERLTDPDALLVLPTFGLRCSVRDLYINTPLNRRVV